MVNDDDTSNWYTRLLCPWDSPGKNTGVGCHFLLQCMKVKSEKWKWSRSVVSDSTTPWTAAYQAPPSMEFSRQESWSGVPLPSPKIVFTNLDNKKNYLIRWLYWRLWWCMLMFCKIQYSLKMYVCIYTLESPLNSQDLESSRRSN